MTDFDSSIVTSRKQRQETPARDRRKALAHRQGGLKNGCD
jgi:hypothetical protein